MRAILAEGKVLQSARECGELSYGCYPGKVYGNDFGTFYDGDFMSDSS